MPRPRSCDVASGRTGGWAPIASASRICSAAAVRLRSGPEAIVPESLFDRVREIRAYRATVKQPSPPSDEYLLRKLLRCERCGARMRRTRGSRPPVRRYLCATRRHGEGCDQAITKAEALEDQLVDWLRDFQPDADLRKLVLDTITCQAGEQSEHAARRSELVEQLRRLQDLYVLGDPPRRSTSCAARPCRRR